MAPSILSTSMKFRRYGRTHQVVIRNADDLARAIRLDEALWVATVAPTYVLAADPTLIALLDVNSDGRIVCEDVRTMARWTLGVLRVHDDLNAEEPSLLPAHIHPDHPDSGRIIESVRKINRRLDRDQDARVTLGEVRAIKTRVESRPVSEAGVVLPSAAEDEMVRQLLTDVVSVTGGAAHPSGANGVDAACLDRFWAEGQAYLDWERRGREDAELAPLGERTPAAWSAWTAVGEKVTQYFSQAEALGFEPRLEDLFRATQQELVDGDWSRPAEIAAMLAQAPLASPRADGLLPLDEGVNPHYAAKVRAFREQVLTPLGFDGPTLTQDDWRVVCGRLAAYDAWRTASPTDAVQALGTHRVRADLGEPLAKEVRALIAASAATAFELGNVRLVEKLILFQAHALDIATNFISFPRLYDPGDRAMFERGTLVIDGRRLTLAVDVRDRAEHAKYATLGSMFVVYIEAQRHDRPKAQYALPVTSGSKGNLAVGKRGLFVDVDGLEWAAEVVQVLEFPISVREALVAPFKRIGKLISGKIESLTAEAEKKLDTVTTAALNSDKTNADQAAQPPSQPAAAPSGGMNGGTLLMGGSVAVAALGSALAYITKTLAGLSGWTVLIGIAVAVLAVALPTGISASLRLRRRDLSSILEACGWAINTRMHLTRKTRRTFTQRPPYPADASGTPRHMVRWIALAILLAGIGAGAWYVATHGWPWRTEEPAATQPADDPAPAEPAAATPKPAAVPAASLAPGPGDTEG